MKSKLLATLLLCCTLPVWVGAQVTPQGTFSGNTICPGGQAQLTFTATAGNGPFTVRYTDGNAIRTQTGVSSGVAFNALSNTTATKTYTLLHVTGTDMGVRNSGFTDASAQVTVSIRPDLKDLTLAPIAPVCAGADASLTLSGFVQNHNFQAQTPITTSANRAFMVYAADLDGDGDLDVLSASNNDDKIAWYKNDGHGGFTAQTAISTSADGAYSVYAADLDGDGDLDVLSASNDNKIAWYKNDGTGNFTAQPAITTSAAAASWVYAADLDGDGDMDVLSASGSDDKIAWYKNDGSGNFTTQPAISTSANNAFAVYAADLDGDGDMDVLSASYSDDKIAWYKNDGSGNFTTQPAITTSANGAHSVYTADLDGDGDQDVLSASDLDDKIAWYKNDGSGNFTTQPAISTSVDGATSVYAADLDGDGDIDVLSTSYYDDKIAWYKNDGSGNFTTQPAISTSADGLYYAYAADLDGDGDLDVLSASANDNKIAWYENHTPFSGNATITYTAGGGELQTATSAVSMGMTTFSLPAPKAGTLTLLKVSNTNGCTAGVSKTANLRHLPRPDLKDLTLDPIAPVCSDASLKINGFVQAQGFETPSAITTSANGANSVYAADLDGDGDLDVLSSSNLDNKIAWYQNNGSGIFTAQPNISTTVDAAAPVHAADLDGDGDIDVVTGSYSNAKIKWYKNDGTGNFTEQPIISSPGASVAMVHTADMDGDGDMDVLSCTLNNQISWYKNDGTGNFGPQHLISTSVNLPYSIYAADLDGDGDMDVLSASSDDDKVAWYKNDGSGNFDPQLVISTSANGARAVHAADLDSDGDMDVLSGSVYDDKIVWYKNDGSGAFIEQTPISISADAPLSVRAADLDSDGDLDVLSASVLDHKIAWYKNDGSGVFTTQTVISTSANGAAFVHTADLDGDGDLDVLSASTGDDKIAWYENRMPFSGNATVTYNISGGTSQTASAPVSTGMATLTIPTPSTGTLNLTKIANANSCETGTSSSVSLTVISPSVGGTVSSVQTICSGTSPADLSLSGQTGDVVKWQKASDANFSTPIDIASTATLTTLPSALIGNLTGNTYFRAVVQNGVCSEVNSSSVLITVNPVSVGGTVSSVQTICSGTSPADLSLLGQTGDVVKWQKSSDANFTNVVDIASTATLTTLPSALIGNLTGNTYFRAVVQSGVCSEVNSSSVLITVNPVSVGGTASSVQTICSGTSPADLSLSGQTGNVVKWQKSSDANFSIPIDIASTATLTTLPSALIGNLTGNTYFRAVVQNGVCSEVNSSSVLITVNPVSVGGTVSSAQTICLGTSPADLSLSGQTGDVVKWQKSSDANFTNAVDISSTATLTTLPSALIGNLTVNTYFRAVVKSGVCSEVNSSSVLIQIHRKPIITLSTLQQTLIEGNSQTFCDTDANPDNSLQFNVSGLCVSGNPVWRVQVANGAWSAWTTNPPVTQSSNNQPHRYQAACDAACASTYSGVIELTINNRATVPQNVSLLVDGVTVAVGESKEVCSLVTIPLAFNANCAAGEVTLYSVDGGEYTLGVPTGLVDNQFHNYRVRCRKSDGTPSCVGGLCD